MKRPQLDRILRLFEVRTEVYDLSGRAEVDEAHCVVAEDERWLVFYSERGVRTSEAMFSTEDAACDELLDRIARDPLTRS